MKRGKKILLALLCVIPMVISAIPASAMEHSCIAIEKPGTREYQSYEDAGNGHYHLYRARAYCQTCERDMGYTNGKEWEGHTQAYYEDLGHVGLRTHRFKLCCGECSGGQVISIICDVNETGRHNTP